MRRQRSGDARSCARVWSRTPRGLERSDACTDPRVFVTRPELERHRLRADRQPVDVSQHGELPRRVALGPHGRERGPCTIGRHAHPRGPLRDPHARDQLQRERPLQRRRQRRIASVAVRRGLRGVTPHAPVVFDQPARDLYLCALCPAADERLQRRAVALGPALFPRDPLREPEQLRVGRRHTRPGSDGRGGALRIG